MKKLFNALLIATCSIVLLTGCGAKLQSIDLNDMVLNYGETKQLEPSYEFDKELSQDELLKTIDSLEIAFLSSDDGVVNVDEHGNITALGSGTATVTAVYKDITAQSEITVNVPLQSVKAEKSLALEINGVEKANVKAEVVPLNATQNAISYSSSDETVATVDKNGEVTIKGEGECVITSSVGTKKAETNVIITTKATGIELKATEGILYVGGSTTLVAYTVPSQAPASTYTYKVDNTSVATVNEKGVVTAKAVGTAKITVTSANGFTAIYNLTVKAKPVNNSTATGGSSSGTASTGGSSSGSSSTGGTTAPEPTPEPTPPPSNVVPGLPVTPGDGNQFGSGD